jgi:endoglucanase
MSDLTALLKRMTDAPGPPGREDAVRAVFRDELGEDDGCDKLGSIFFRHGESDGPKIMLTAHMDEIGFMVQTITSKGFLRIAPLGGWWTHTLLSQPVTVMTANGDVPGIIASKPPHQLSESERTKVLSLENLLIDVGASSAEDARERLGITEGDVIVPDSPMRLMAGDKRAVAKAMDNRVGCCMAVGTMQALKGESLPNDLWCVGTVQEEVGCRGAVTASRRLKPDVGLVLEGPPADDLPGTPACEQQGKLGGGPQIRMLDPTAISNRRLVDFVKKVAKEEDIPVQVAVRRSGGTDARSIHLANEGTPTIVVGVAARYIHSHNSIVELSDVAQAVDLLVAVIKRLDKATVDGFVTY